MPHITDMYAQYMAIYNNIYDIGSIYDILYASIYDTYMPYMGMYGSYMQHVCVIYDCSVWDETQYENRLFMCAHTN